MSVYFIKAANGRVKIGYSGNLERRVSELLRMHGGEFLGSMPGDRSVERHFHVLYRRQRLAGEWFESSDDMLAMIAALAVPAMAVDSIKDVSAKLRHMDLKFAREASDALSEMVLAIRDNEPVEVVKRLMAPAMGLSESRFLAILDCEAEYVTAAEYTQIMNGPELARQAYSSVVVDPTP